MDIPITDIEEGRKAIISGLKGGRGFQIRLRNMGIREGKTVTVVTKHPFNGPLVLEVDGRTTTIGRGMAGRIIVRVEP